MIIIIVRGYIFLNAVSKKETYILTRAERVCILCFFNFNAENWGNNLLYLIFFFLWEIMFCFMVMMNAYYSPLSIWTHKILYLSQKKSEGFYETFHFRWNRWNGGSTIKLRNEKNRWINCFMVFFIGTYLGPMLIWTTEILPKIKCSLFFKCEFQRKMYTTTYLFIFMYTRKRTSHSHKLKWRKGTKKCTTYYTISIKIWEQFT